MHRFFSLLLVVGVVVGMGKGALARSGEVPETVTTVTAGHAAAAAMSLPLGERQGEPPLALIAGLLLLAIGARGRVVLARRGAW